MNRLPLGTALETQKMTKSLILVVVTLALICEWSFKGMAQITQYVTLHAPAQCALQTNQVVSIVGLSPYSVYFLYGYFPDGTNISLLPQSPLYPQIFTGLTNIVLTATPPTSPTPYWATLQITTPASANVVSNYIPADAIVIPASATGNVQIILESSMDLVNWTAASPGTYGASSATNRFFRVRAVVN